MEARLCCVLRVRYAFFAMADDPEETEDEDGLDNSESSDDSDDDQEEEEEEEEEEASADDGDDSDQAEASDDDGDDSDQAEASDDDGDDSDQAEASDDDGDDTDGVQASDDDDDDAENGKASGQQITKGDLDQGTDLPTGDNHDLVIPYEDVDVEIELPPYIAERLPGDFTLTLSADDMDDQTVTASGAERTVEGAVRFAFGWRKKTRSVTLKATSGDQSVTLWDDQVVGDLSTMIDWESWLDPLLVPEEEITADDPRPTGANSTPPDLNSEQLPDLLGDE
jgi:hypothetical protein